MSSRAQKYFEYNTLGDSIIEYKKKKIKLMVLRRICTI